MKEQKYSYSQRIGKTTFIVNFCALHRICSMEDPHHSEHTSDHLAVVYDDRVHRIVFRLQTEILEILKSWRNSNWI